MHARTRQKAVDKTRPFVNDLSRTIADAMHVCDPFYPNISIDNNHDVPLFTLKFDDHLPSNCV